TCRDAVAFGVRACPFDQGRVRHLPDPDAPLVTVGSTGDTTPGAGLTWTRYALAHGRLGAPN
ncbi:MAG: hypothetical protein ACTHMR_03155, partial [Thermomicrobiales bacterium]